MSKITIIEGNSNDKDQIRTFLVKGEKGDTGEQGPIGDNQLTIGTVTSGATASAEITGTSPNQTLNLVLPKGDKGDKGDKGEQGNLDFTGYTEYDSSLTYNEGDYCIYNDKLYVCNTDDTTGTWDSSHWTETSIKELIDDIEENVENNTTDISTMQNKLVNFNRYYTAWDRTLIFQLPLGHQALLMAAQDTLYLLWNPNDQLQFRAIYGSGVSFSRGSDDVTITATRNSGNTTFTAIVF